MSLTPEWERDLLAHQQQYPTHTPTHTNTGPPMRPLDTILSLITAIALLGIFAVGAYIAVPTVMMDLWHGVTVMFTTILERL